MERTLWEDGKGGYDWLGWALKKPCHSALNGQTTFNKEAARSNNQPPRPQQSASTA